MSDRIRIAVVVGSINEPARTATLAQALAAAVQSRVEPAAAVAVQTWLVSRLLPHLVAGGDDATLARVLSGIAQADLLIAASPVYKGSYTGLFKHLFDLLPQDALVGKPVVLAATGGSDRHALMVDHQLRPLFGFFRALTVPSAVYASDADFDGRVLKPGPLRVRIAEAAGQAGALLLARVAAGPHRERSDAHERMSTCKNLRMETTGAALS